MSPRLSYQMEDRTSLYTCSISPFINISYVSGIIDSMFNYSMYDFYVLLLLF